MSEPKAKQARGNVVVVDDEAGMRVALAEVLERSGWNVETFENAEAALERLSQPRPGDVLMTDFQMPGLNGLELVRQVRRLHPSLPIIMMTAYGTVEDAVTAMKEGVDDYLLKPFSFETVLGVVNSVVSKAEKATAEPRGDVRVGSRAGGSASKPAIGTEPAWTDALAMGEEVADSGATVLLLGESGTGKEVLAQHIHECSGRSGPLVAINCAALPEGVLESELFGHERGAFTGAVMARKGKFELADGGTILLDEVSEMPLALQAKLLRVLQEREVSPIGADDTRKLDIRVIATTNRDLESYVEEGQFRRDLYYRLNVISIHLPALRHRRGDIALLADHFAQKFQRPGSDLKPFGSDVIDYFARHDWPGNVRELENLVERACLLSRGDVIELRDLHLKNANAAIARDSGFDSRDIAGSEPRLVGRTLEDMEREMILRTLDHTSGNRTRTAEMLGVSVRTIRNKLNQYDIAKGPREATPVG